MEVVQVVNKETIMNVLEKFCIYEETYNSIQLNNNSTISCNRILETTVKHKYASERQAPADTSPFLQYSVEDQPSKHQVCSSQLMLYAVYYVVYIHIKCK